MLNPGQYHAVWNLAVPHLIDLVVSTMCLIWLKHLSLRESCSANFSRLANIWVHPFQYLLPTGDTLYMAASFPIL
uniref:Uncharacterized protein n=1 Tax=Arundo donax TaxID=35708 RepID=A0A0A8YQJ9_ARUDO